MGDGVYDSVEVKNNIHRKPTCEKENKQDYTCGDSEKFDETLSITLDDKTNDITLDDKTNDISVSPNEEENIKILCKNVKPSGFEILRSLDCDSSYFCGEIRDDSYCNDAGDTDVNSVVGKRNRQDSCNSAANDSSSKNNKKSRKKHLKKQELDEEIEKILADIEMGGKAPLGKSENSDDLISEKKIKSTENIFQSEKVTKKKKKNKKSHGGQATENIEPVNEASVHENLNIETSPQKRDKKEISELHSAVCEKEPDNTCEDSLSEEKMALSGTKKDRKRPGKKQIAAIQAVLQKAKEEEEKLRQEELMKQKRAEEAERLRLEKLRLEEERKLKKKQKEKEKKERLKAQGKLLNKAQKQVRARNEATILAWREHGIDIPNIGEKRTASETKNNYRRKHNSSKSSNTDEEQQQPSLTVSLSSLENGNIDDSTENGSNASSHSWGKNLHRSLEVKSLSESSDSNHDLDKRFHSDVTLHTSSSGILKNGSLSKSQSVHCIKEHSKIRSAQLIADDMKISSDSKYRSPVVCVLGHVDTGKTKILDYIRKTHVQAGEAGGITQQIGATMVPYDALKEKCSFVKSFANFELKLPGLLIIDTPGHESFRNLRSRGSSLCDIAILVVDIMHGLEQQTIESLNLLKQRKTPFVVALNKIDRIYGWKSSDQEDIEDVMKSQDESTKMEFDRRYKQLVLQFANESLNVALFYDNPDPRSYVSLIPVSAITGDGMGNILAFLCQLTQNMMPKRLTFSEDLEATVLEVKTTAGLGTTIDVILVNGRLKEGDTIVLAGQEGPVVSQVRSLLMPQPLKELRVKNPYIEYKEIKGAQGVKVSGRELDKVIAGLPLYVARNQDEVLALKEKVSSLLRCAISSIRLSERGVYVQASTLGSLEALLEFLKSSEIPYAGVKVGPVVKKDVIKASVMLEHDVQYAVILAFDVKMERDAQELAESLGIKIFQADIIYHLFESFIEYREMLLEKRKNDAKKLAVFPCKLRILPQYVFNIRDPIVLGVRVEAGVLKVGTPLCVPSKNALFVGCAASLEMQHQIVECAKSGDEVCVTIEPGDESPKTYGRQFDHEDILVSRINRQTIDICKEFYRKDLTKSDWQLMVELKKLLHVT